MDDRTQIRYSVAGIVLLIVGGLLLLFSSSWIGYIGAVVAVVGAGMVAFVLFRGNMP